jgi:hypothetical protein
MTQDEFISEIRKRAEEEGIAPSTYCERRGQGGHFYKRMLSGARCWPETMSRVLGPADTQRE